MTNYSEDLDRDSIESEINAGDILNAHIDQKFFPLQTFQSMADRWGLTRQNVWMKFKQDAEFPREVSGIITRTARTPKVFSMHDVLRYEKLRGLKRDGKGDELERGNGTASEGRFRASEKQSES